MEKTTLRIQQLRDAIEQNTGKPPATPKEFDVLAADIYEQLHESVSASTLKRIWGYVGADSTPRNATLNVLAKFVGYNDWHDFCHSMGDEEKDFEDAAMQKAEPLQEGSETEQEGNGKGETIKHRAINWKVWGIVALATILLLIGGIALWRQSDEKRLSEENSDLVLHAGQTFARLEDYLALFGIEPGEQWWDEQLPHHRGMLVWSPRYQHPNWHNEGNPDSLFPTITEWWSPTEEEADSISEDAVKQKNANLYFTVTRTKELRITFMLGIAEGDSATFLGVYRLDETQSDSTHLVWQRIADRCDLRSLDYLEELRN